MIHRGPRGQEGARLVHEVKPWDRAMEGCHDWSFAEGR
jgi:hypothetical protein